MSTDTLMTVKQVAEYLGLSAARVYHMRHEGAGPPSIKLSPGNSGAVRYRRSDVDAWLDERMERRAVRSGDGLGS